MPRRAGRLAMWTLLLACWLLIPATAAVMAAEPAPSAPAVTGTVDPRSEGEGPADAPSPVLIALAVVAAGVLTAAGTLLVVRVTRR